jgi:ribonucleoside-diphosphate reductase alpha chain
MDQYNLPIFTPTGFSEKIFRDRYSFTDTETWQEACIRVASQIALAEPPAKQSCYRNKFYDFLSSNLFVPGGRIWYNSGRPNPQLLNCFVLNPNKDSKEGWGESAYNLIVTSMTGGGCGDDFSDVRPRGATIAGQRGAAPGAVELMRLLDGCAGPIRAGGQRRVALMFSLDLGHPDIEEFLSAKLVKGELTHANVSVRSRHTKAFIKAVKDDGEIELHWKGQYKRQIKARLLWDVIVKNAYNSAEPGFLNWELAEHESNIYYIEELVTTNPCGEIALEAFGNCCLGHIVLSRFVENGEINYAKLGDTIRLGVRFLDNALSVNHFPLIKMQDNAKNLRRIGLGTTALADTLALLGHRYGSEEGNKFIDKLYRFISKAAYEASVLLAIEKGAFPLCNPLKHVESGFMKRMPAKTKSLVLEHGIRNCAILTQAPTGTVSILSENCSSGIEPMFASSYYRRYWDGDTRKKELVFHPLFEKFMIEKKDVSHFVGTHDLTVRDHLEVQKIIQRHCDNAVSKTINLPHDYPIEDMEKLWLEYLPYLKGTTFYREKTRGYVDPKTGEVQEPPLTPIPLKEAKKLFKEKHVVGSETVSDCPSGICTI